ncbi:MAG: lambda exonuclease family protein [Dermatophilaceae bacterium]
MTLNEYPDVIQGSDEWHDQRRGIVTASVVGQLVSVGSADGLDVGCATCGAVAESPCFSLTRKEPTPIKTLHPGRIALAASRPPVISVADNEKSRSLVATLAAERVTGWTDPVFVSSDMMRGTLDEPFARNLYDEHYSPVTEIGFTARTEDGWTLGYSPDGLVGDGGLIEVKSRKSKGQLTTILADDVPPWHMAQCQAGLLVTGRKWLDYVSYCSGMPLYVKRVQPDPSWQEAIVKACIDFERKVAEITDVYTERTANLFPTERIDHNDIGLVF